MICVALQIYFGSENGLLEGELEVTCSLKQCSIDPGVTPPTSVFHPDLGVGDNLEQTEIWNATWWKYTFKRSSSDLVRPGEVFQRRIYQVKKSCL